MRNKIAAGELSRFSSAHRMAQVQWDDQLAYLADLNTKQCRMSHDHCHNTRKINNLHFMLWMNVFFLKYSQKFVASFDFAGQNLGFMAMTGAISTDKFLLKIMNSWWNEHADTNIKEMRSYPKFSMSGK
jgi:aspartate/tyrosine/aromatic aminotransferase